MLGLSSLVGVKLAYIPTASNYESGNKDWMIDNLIILRDLGFDIDIVDFSALSKEMWLSRLNEVKILFFEGGNTQYLRQKIKESGFEIEIESLLTDRLWIGASAGSCVVCPTIVNSIQDLFDETIADLPSDGLGLVNFQIVPHLNSPYFDKIRENELRFARKEMQKADGTAMYAIDDNSAISVDGSEIKIISSGVYFSE